MAGTDFMLSGRDSLKLDPPSGFDEAIPTARSILLIPVSAFCIERRQ